MLEFKIIEEFPSNEEIVSIFKQCKFKYRIGKGVIKECIHTNIQFIVPTIYLITYPYELIIHEYKVNEVSGKPYYIRENNKKYNLKELKQILINLKTHKIALNQGNML